MGTRNRQRRAEKRRRRERASTSGQQRRSSSGGLPLRSVIYAAVDALPGPDPLPFRALMDTLADAGPPAWREVDVVIGEACGVIRAANWEDSEVARQAERRLGADHARYLAGVVAGRPVTIDALVYGIEVLALLLALPPLPRLGERSGPARPGHDTRVLEKVRALLAKAESTTFPEEAEALSAKAQELMARHAIDEAMVGAAGAGTGAADRPTGARVPVDDPYAGAKSILLSQVASANGCRAVWSKDLGISTVIGYESDVEFVEILYTSLLVQATAAMVSAGSQVDRYGRSRTRSFRQSFLLAYATRIGQRLRAAEAASRSSATEQYGAALVPVLADRSAAVDDAAASAFPGAVSRTVSINNAAGWAAGSAAADLASLSGRAEVPRTG